MIFDKTDKGREEIATRKHHLSSKFRPLLVMTDGNHSAEYLLAKVAGLGIDQHALDELLKHGFIYLLDEEPAPAAERVTAPRRIGPSSVPVSGTPVPKLADGETQLNALSHFFNETIRNTIGLRGFALQLKVERANSIDEFRALRAPYLEAVFKAKGADTALSLGGRLDELLDMHLPTQ
ncbi:MAG: hypothetical protein H7315_02515 [Herminiimonas sp.]|nr:hypothetical protein [Herminiimonas sp.]